MTVESEFKNVSDWPNKLVSTTGTRDKLVIIDPVSQEEYFLKFPMVKENRDYSAENWSEVIAYEVGIALGFNVLRYELVEYNGKVGCLSKNMLSGIRNGALVEGHTILHESDTSYDPRDKHTYDLYTFDFVREALQRYAGNLHVKEFVRILIFDAIIGNSDRHQSNWAIISYPEELSVAAFKHKTAPIYDSGCCLGREFKESQIQSHLDDCNKFNKYIRGGKAELRTGKEVGKKKSSHEELLCFIKYANREELKLFVDDEINRVLQMYDREKTRIKTLVLQIDRNLPERYRLQYGLTKARKEFILQVIDARIDQFKCVLQCIHV